MFIKRIRKQPFTRCTETQLDLTYEQWEIDVRATEIAGTERLLELLIAAHRQFEVRVFQKACRPVCLRQITLLDHTILLESNHFFEKHVRVSPFTSRTGLIRFSADEETSRNLLAKTLQGYSLTSSGRVTSTTDADIFSCPIQWPDDLHTHPSETMLYFWHDDDLLMVLHEAAQ